MQVSKGGFAGVGTRNLEDKEVKKSLVMVLIGLLVLALAGCAAGPNPEVYTAAADGTIAGFWLGLWHGMISPFTFIVSLFTNDVTFYEVHNNGGWYDFGFVLGAGILFSGGSKAT